MSAPVGDVAPDSDRVIPEWTLGDRLRKIRRMTGDGQAEFAAKLGANEKSYAAWELDYNSPRNLVAIAKRIEAMTGVPASWVLDIDVHGAFTGRYAGHSENVISILGRLTRGTSLGGRHDDVRPALPLGRTSEDNDVAS